ncbi:MAG: preprotein translocase subunit TatB [Rhodocyclaceae bacterium]|nr:preprotein translocase subunit TatB [Rhodocyclaceae bacterium]MDZ4215411.1 preprotein translocase subunit TatB [Rhodocyclaceae bacterium]
MSRLLDTLCLLLDPAVESFDTLGTLAALIAELRPARGATSADKLRALASLLQARPDLRAALRGVLLDLIVHRHGVLLFATAGIYPSTGIFSETFRRFAHRLLPEAEDDEQLKDALEHIVRPRDAAWLTAVPAADWAVVFAALRFKEETDGNAARRFAEDLFEALRVVAHRIAAAGLEPEMLRLDPTLENHVSPYLALCEEALAFAQAAEAKVGAGETAPPDVRHLHVLIDQARTAGERVRRRAQQLGASFHLTFGLRRLAQHLDRLERLTALAEAMTSQQDANALAHGAALWQELAVAACRRNDLAGFWRENTELMALRVTENAGKSGERYIGETRADWYAMLRSAAGGGIIIALMAANKVYLGTLGLAPLAEVLAYCLNYSLGFMLIHLLHFTVATKQPAMTANAIAAAIGDMQSGGKERQRDPTPVVDLVARTMRTQLAAILGNIGLAVPVAMLVSLLYWWLTGAHYIDADKAGQLLGEIDPIASGAILFAAVAGVCLFLAGLIAGYYDNLCAYNRIPQRLYRLGWPRWLFGNERWQRVTDYIAANLGALAGNFFFGFLLGGAAGLGMLLGLPLDIRHIAFSSAYWGYAMVGLEFGVAWQTVALAALGVLLIGLTNLAVSFSLAMWIGLKARGVDLRQRLRLIRAILWRFLTHPGDLFLPPRDYGLKP